jgi:uncharacterized surface protein with fasciclin (FAS1) repeats
MLASLIATALLASVAQCQDSFDAFLQTQSDLSTFRDLLQLTNLTEALAGASNLTILVPTDAAFENLPTSDPEALEGASVLQRDPEGLTILFRRHVIQGSFPSESINAVPVFPRTLLTPELAVPGQNIANTTGGQSVGLFLQQNRVRVLSGELNLASVVQADLRFGGLIIHKIDGVARFGAPVTAVASRANLELAAGALATSGIAETVDEAQDLTIFLPTDEAFDLIGSAVASASSETLRDILAYHAFAGEILFSPSFSNTTLDTLQGGPLTASVFPDGSIFVNNAKIILPNVILSNGVLHIIDSVLNPANATIERKTSRPELPPQQRIQFGDVSALQLPTFSTISVLPSTTYALNPIVTEYPAVSAPMTTASFVPTTSPGVAPSDNSNGTASIVPYTGEASGVSWSVGLRVALAVMYIARL